MSYPSSTASAASHPGPFPSALISHQDSRYAPNQSSVCYKSHFENLIGQETASSVHLHRTLKHLPSLELVTLIRRHTPSQATRKDAGWTIATLWELRAAQKKCSRLRYSSHFDTVFGHAEATFVDLSSKTGVTSQTYDQGLNDRRWTSKAVVFDVDKAYEQLMLGSDKPAKRRNTRLSHEES